MPTFGGVPVPLHDGLGALEARVHELPDEAQAHIPGRGLRRGQRRRASGPSAQAAAEPPKGEASRRGRVDIADPTPARDVPRAPPPHRKRGRPHPNPKWP